MTQKRGKGKKRSTTATADRQTLPTLEVSNRTGTSPSVLTIDFRVTVAGKGVAHKTNIAIAGTLRSAYFTKRGPHRTSAKCSLVHLSEDDLAPSPEQTQNGNNVKDCNATAEQTQAGGKSSHGSKKERRRYPCISAKVYKEPRRIFTGPAAT